MKIPAGRTAYVDKNTRTATAHVCCVIDMWKLDILDLGWDASLLPGKDVVFSSGDGARVVTSTVGSVYGAVVLELDAPCLFSSKDELVFLEPLSSPAPTSAPPLPTKVSASPGKDCPDCGRPMTLLLLTYYCGSCLGSRFPSGPVRPWWRHVWNPYSEEPKVMPEGGGSDERFRNARCVVAFSPEQDGSDVKVVRNVLRGNVGQVVSLSSEEYRQVRLASESSPDHVRKDHGLSFMVPLVEKSWRS